ncbi:MAG: PKD domain-containing protein, partial [Bacteroidia bacterium]|nr:PKD domain-containing protein [Bacteroidia bacterium]
MIKNIFLLVFILCSNFIYSQQLTDFFTYYLHNTSPERQQFIFGKVWHWDFYNSLNDRHITTDKQNVYLINTIAGDMQIETYFSDTFIKEKPYQELATTSLYFCKYNLESHKIIYLPFGSNYDNDVWAVKMDEQKKSILAIVSTKDDTVRLNPRNQNDFIAFPNRMQRYWILIFDLDGNLLNSYYLAEIEKNNKNIQNITISKFDYLNDIVLTFVRSSNVKKLFPWQYNDTIIHNNNTQYIVCYSPKNNIVKWYKYSNKYFSTVRCNVEGINIAASIQLNKTDSSFILYDEKNNVVNNFDFKDEKIPYNHYLTYCLKFDTWGNITPLFYINSKSGAEITSIIQNNNEILAIVAANDSFNIFNSSFYGEKDKFYIYNCIYFFNIKKYNRFSLLKIDLNKQTAKYLIKPGIDSIAPQFLIKAKQGFYVLYRYSNVSTEFNLLPDDTIINIKDDNLYNRDDTIDLLTICKYDSNYRFLWMSKVLHLNNIDDYGENIIFDYPLRGFDIDFRPERIGEINPYPHFLQIAIYNCKPLAYYQSSKLTENTYKFTNLSNYNCKYKWIFGDGNVSTQKSPTHKFKPSSTSYKVALIVTNDCGSDTFYRYLEITAGVPVYSYSSFIKIYPNPVSGNVFNISLTENTEIKSLKIYNTIGHQLDECTFNQISKTDYSAAISHKLPKG